MKELQEVRLDAFVAASQRVRWTLLGIVLLGGLVVLQQYLELFGFQRAQFVHAHYRALVKPSPSVMEEFETHRKTKKSGNELVNAIQWTPAKLKDLGVRVPESSEQFATAVIAAYAEKLVRIRESQNTLGKLAVEPRKLPFLGLDVPGNDFVPVLASMLVGLAVLGWLNVRFMRATLGSYLVAACSDLERLRVIRNELQQAKANKQEQVKGMASDDPTRKALDETLIEWEASLEAETHAAARRRSTTLELARSHFIFSATGENNWSELLARTVQWAAIGAPVFSIAFALAVDLWIVDDWDNVPPLAVFVRLAVLSIGLAMSTALCVLAAGQAKQIDKLVQP